MLIGRNDEGCNFAAVITNVDEKETEQKKVPISGVRFIEERKKQIYNGASSRSDIEE